MVIADTGTGFFMGSSAALDEIFYPINCVHGSYFGVNFHDSDCCEYKGTVADNKSGEEIYHYRIFKCSKDPTSIFYTFKAYCYKVGPVDIKDKRQATWAEIYELFFKEDVPIAPIPIDINYRFKRIIKP